MICEYWLRSPSCELVKSVFSPMAAGVQMITSAFAALNFLMSGNKIYDLYLRADDDVISKKPDVVVIWVGVNDVWHKSMYGTGTDQDKFEKFYDALIKKLRAANADVIICTPAAIGEKTDFTNSQDGDLNQYSQIIRGIAQKNNCRLVDLRKVFLDYNLSNNKDNIRQGILTTDGVHLNEKGNSVVAEEMMKALNGRQRAEVKGQ